MKTLTLRNCKILSKNYKYVVSYFYFLIIFRKKFGIFKIPYWITKSNLTEEIILELDEVVKQLNRE